MYHRSHQAAFTLVELMVSIAVIGVLLGLLLPAIQMAREAARRSLCQSNLRQLHLAMHSHEQTYKAYPTGGWGYGWLGFSNLGTGPEQPGSWTIAVLPYIEQTELYRKAEWIDNDPVATDRNIQTLMKSTVPLMNCPSRRTARLYPQGEIGADLPAGATTAILRMPKGDYAVNYGDTAPDEATIYAWPYYFIGPLTMSDARRVTANNGWPRVPEDWSGISFIRASVGVAGVTDGLSNTFLMGEKYIDAAEYLTGKDDGDNESLFSGFNNDNHRSTHPYWPYMADKRKLESIGSFGSAHAGGGNFVLCDGSTKAISYSIDKQTFRWLGNRRDGNSVNVDDY
jgi:prepilin-type N-terminal cleavage/methylation domain-containing protein